jgi:hypothetical protein
MSDALTLPAVRTISQSAPAAPARVPDLLPTLAEIERVAKACAASGYYRDVRDASQALVKMLAGREMGMGPIAALAGIHIIDGKPAAGANAIAANVKRSGRYDYRVVQRDDQACVLAWFEHGEPVGESRFDHNDAKRAGLWGKQNWAKFPRAMLFARALTEGVRVYCPDATGGVIYTPEELSPDRAVTEDAEPVTIDAPAPREERDVTPPREQIEAPAPRFADGGISEKQGKRLWALAAKRAEALPGIDRTDIVRDVLMTRGIEHTREIPRDAYERICEDVQTWAPPTDPREDLPQDVPGVEEPF